MFNSNSLKLLLVTSISLLLVFLLILFVSDTASDDPIGLASDIEERYKNASAGYQSSGNNTSDFIAEPVFIHNSGYYEEAITLEITADEEFTIYYTLDSSTPDESSTLYTDPINIEAMATDETEDSAVVVRAIAYSASGKCSEVVTKVYCFAGDDSTYKDVLATVSIVTDPRNLYDETIGIFANYSMLGWEREAEFLYIDTDGTAYEQTINIKLRGLNSRSSEQMSFTLLAGQEYDEGSFAVSLFETDTDTWILRTRTIAQQEGFISSLVSDRDVTVQEYQMTRTYINGEYCGVYSLLTNIDTDFLRSKYQLDNDTLAFIKFPVLDESEEADMTSYYEMVSYLIYTDMSVTENYLQACEIMDMQSLIDYYCIQIYINNVDFCYGKNTILWKTYSVSDGEYSDGKWRYALYDLDAALYYDWPGGESSYDFNFFTEDFPYAVSFYEDTIIQSLMDSPLFREQFYSSFIEIAQTNFDPERVLALLDEQPYTTDNDKIAEFFENRPLYIFDYLDDFMENYEEYYAAAAETTAEETETEEENLLTLIRSSEVLRIGLPIFCLILLGLAFVFMRCNGTLKSTRKAGR